MSNHARVSPGVPSGGQFAAVSRPESDTQIPGPFAGLPRVAVARGQILRDDEATDDIVNSADGGRISDSTARTIAAWYQSPGGTGSTLAELASTGRAARDELLDDIARTRRSDPSDDTKTFMDAIENWVRTSDEESRRREL